MKKFIFTLGLTLISIQIFANLKPYVYEYRASGRTIIFQGTIAEENEPKVRSLQTKYLNSLNGFINRKYYKLELEKLGVRIEEVQENPSGFSR